MLGARAGRGNLSTSRLRNTSSAAMVRAGYDSADLELDAAFERGMKYAGLR